ncbi:hypothetical protein HispidOSU_028817 [Sigmodon hispidus]
MGNHFSKALAVKGKESRNVRKFVGHLKVHLGILLQERGTGVTADDFFQWQSIHTGAGTAASAVFTVEIESIYDTSFMEVLEGMRNVPISSVPSFRMRISHVPAHCLAPKDRCVLCLELRGMRISRPHSYRAAGWSHHALVATNTKHEVSSP